MAGADKKGLELSSVAVGRADEVVQALVAASVCFLDSVVDTTTSTTFCPRCFPIRVIRAIRG
jgi:hypothetical protein